ARCNARSLSHASLREWSPLFPYTTLFRSDLTGWPDGIRYVAYGQHMGYTNGMTATEFSQQTPADATMYCTYVLRENSVAVMPLRSEEHTSELQSRFDLVCRLLLEKKNNQD